MKTTNFNDLRKKYLELSGCVCPFCDSNDLLCDNVEFDGSVGFQRVKCNNCKKAWTDTLTLTDVTFDDESNLS
jgi:transposase-like protein